jgi:hypothetical protein
MSEEYSGGRELATRLTVEQTIHIYKIQVEMKHRNTHRTNPGTEAEPQQIVAQGLLSCLQYPVP